MSVRAAERALILLNYLIENDDGLGVREVSRRLGYSPSTVQGLVNTLSAQGYVTQDDLTGRYHLGPRAIQLGLVALSRLEVRNIARTHMEMLSRETGETSFLGIARGRRLIYIDRALGDHPIRLDVPLGKTVPTIAPPWERCCSQVFPTESLSDWTPWAPLSRGPSAPSTR